MNRKNKVIYNRSQPLESLDSLDDSKIDTNDIATFLPWVCDQLNVDVILDITRNVSADSKLLSARKPKPRNLNAVPKAMVSEYDYDQQTHTTVKSSYSYNVIDDRTVHMLVTYRGEFLQHIKIHKSKRVPRGLLRVLDLIIKLYPQLYGITINGGIDQFTIYEMSRFISKSNITEINLDNSHCRHGNYYMLLECCKQLTMLSLARCKLGDEAAEKIALQLASPLSSSTTLVILNLASNKLTDKTAQNLANALRSNRKLSYLNLADNMITDEGAVAILKALYKFPLTKEETLDARRKYVRYLKQKTTMANKIFAKLQPTDAEFTFAKKKRHSRLHASESKADIKGHITKSPTKSVNSEANLEAHLRERAEDMAEVQLKEHPIVKELFYKDGWIFCKGNNTLAYLNIAYNNVSYITVKFLLLVLNHQREISRKPKGLVNVCLEGNPLPKCDELTMIDNLLETPFRLGRTPSLTKKRSFSRLQIEGKVTIRGFDS